MALRKTPDDSCSTGTATQRRRVTLKTRKSVVDDQFMASAIGDLPWLKQSLARHIEGEPLKQDRNGLTSLHLACLHCHLDCIKHLVEDLQCDVNMPSSTGWRPIHLVINKDASKRAFQCFTYLLDNGAETSVANDDGFTPCHQAASEGHLQCLQRLIDTNADIRRKDARGHTPLELAKLWGHRKCARLLASALWKVNKEDVAREMKLLKDLRNAQEKRDIQTAYEEKLQRGITNREAFRKWLDTHCYVKKEAEFSVAEIEEGAARRLKQIQASSSKGFSGKHELNTIDVSEDPDLRITKPLLSCSKSRRNKRWNFSPKVPTAEYVTNLDDDYPRDDYTKMPKMKNAPKYFDGRFRNVTWINPDDGRIDDGDDFRKYKTNTLDTVTLTKTEVDNALAKDLSLVQRPVIFKPHHISDIATLKQFSAADKVRSEAAIYMYPDRKSTLFQMSLQSGPSDVKSSNVDSIKSTLEMLKEYTIFERPQFIYDRVRKSVLDGTPSAASEPDGASSISQSIQSAKKSSASCQRDVGSQCQPSLSFVNMEQLTV